MQTEDEQAIFKEIDAFIERWNLGDARAAASFFTDDCVRVGAFGDVQHGRAEIQAAYDKLFHQTLPGVRVNQERGQLRFVSSELAIWQGGIEIIPPGDQPTLKGHVIQLMKKVDGRWLILETHPKLFPTILD